jgi:hypothetical protein
MVVKIEQRVDRHDLFIGDEVDDPDIVVVIVGVVIEIAFTDLGRIQFGQIAYQQTDGLVEFIGVLVMFQMRLQFDGETKPVDSDRLFVSVVYLTPYRGDQLCFDGVVR